MARVFIVLILLFLVLPGGNIHAQSESSPVKIRGNRVAFGPGNRYAFYMPTFEFHLQFQDQFNYIRSSITADYDYQRQDMGFGMSHALYRYIINPGISVEDNLYFRKVFNDSTGIWNRTQSITPFLAHELAKGSYIGMEFKIEQESSPKIREGSNIVKYFDRSVKVFYITRLNQQNPLNSDVFYLSFERSYKILKGSYNYLLLESLLQYSAELNRYIRYKNVISFQGNLTPQKSPLFFLGGLSNLIGYENDEFWGRQASYSQNLLEIKPYPNYSFSISHGQFRHLALLLQFDAGRVSGAPDIPDIRAQDEKWKFGMGIGFGVNTDLPHMSNTDLHFMFAFPSNDPKNVKFYAGFGGWIN
jgi:hypothetical protein